MSKVDELVQKGLKTLDDGDTAEALRYFEAALDSGAAGNPLVECSYAVCLAAERQEYERAIGICQDAITREPGKSIHYLNLGRIYIYADRKKEAIRTFRDGLLFERNPRIVDAMNRLGWRNLPAIQSLGREHPLNRFLGKLFRSRRRRR